MSYLLLVIASLLTSLGQLCQKQAVHSRSKATGKWMIYWLIAALGLMAIAMLLWLIVLQQLPLSVAYPMLSGNFIFVTLMAHWCYGEKTSPRQWLGILSIMLGIALMSR